MLAPVTVTTRTITGLVIADATVATTTRARGIRGSRLPRLARLARPLQAPHR
jgi:hypothetical protein